MHHVYVCRHRFCKCLYALACLPMTLLEIHFSHTVMWKATRQPITERADKTQTGRQTKQRQKVAFYANCPALCHQRKSLNTCFMLLFCLSFLVALITLISSRSSPFVLSDKCLTCFVRFTLMFELSC